MKKCATEKRRAKAEAKEGKRSSREVQGGSTLRDKRAREGRVQGHLENCNRMQGDRASDEEREEMQEEILVSRGSREKMQKMP